VTLRINDTQHNETQYRVLSDVMLTVVLLSVAFSYCYAECYYTECLYAECHYAECCGAANKLECLSFPFTTTLVCFFVGKAKSLLLERSTGSLTPSLQILD
jgi:hypothetical protein